MEAIQEGHSQSPSGQDTASTHLLGDQILEEIRNAKTEAGARAGAEAWAGALEAISVGVGAEAGVVALEAVPVGAEAVGKLYVQVQEH